MKLLKSLAQLPDSLPSGTAPGPITQPAAVQTRSGTRPRLQNNETIVNQRPTEPISNYQPDFDDLADDGPIEIPTSTADQLALYKQITLKRDKENRFGPATTPKKSIHDRQPGAQKLQFDVEQELEESQHSDEQGGPPNHGRKRSRDVEDDVDDPYHEDERPEDPQRRKKSRVNPPQAPRQERRPQPAAAPVSRVNRLPPRQLPAGVAPRDPQPAREGQQQRGARQNSYVSYDDPAPPPRGALRRPRQDNALVRAPAREVARARSHDDVLNELHGPENYEITRERQRLIAAFNRKKAINKPQKTRVSWSEDEEKKLIEMMGLYPCQWALIKIEAGDALAERDQVALKDKARNMKFSALK